MIRDFIATREQATTKPSGLQNTLPDVSRGSHNTLQNDSRPAPYIFTFLSHLPNLINMSDHTDNV